MTVRWSNPSGGLGVHRFHVWPAGSDSYSFTDLYANFDTADGILGQPSDASQWPPSTGLDGGIYKEIRLLQLDRSPIGVVASWFRPSLSVPIPTGWLPCDGSVVLAANHDFPGIASDITLPDLRNAFVLGADATLALGTAAATVGSGNIDTKDGAPGANAAGGSNKVVQTEAQLAPHNHGGVTGGPSIGVLENTSAASQNIPSNAGGPWVNNSPTEQHTHSIATDGSGSPMDNRPRYVGLIYLCKVKFADAI